MIEKAIEMIKHELRRYPEKYRQIESRKRPSRNLLLMQEDFTPVYKMY